MGYSIVMSGAENMLVIREKSFKHALAEIKVICEIMILVLISLE